jgi:hypothetical protein
MLVFNVEEVNVVAVLTEGTGTGMVLTVAPFPLQTPIHISQNLGVSPQVDAVFTARVLCVLAGSTRYTPGE